MDVIDDEFMRTMLTRTTPYCVVILKGTQKLGEPGAEAVVWEHARRNFQLRTEGVLRVVCPIRDGGVVTGVGIFGTSPDETRRIMEGDPGVQAGLFTYQIHPSRSFAGDAL